MKNHILTTTIATLAFALPALRADEAKKDGSRSSSTATSVVTAADGTATVTIDINGKKETRTFKLGDGNNTFTFGGGDDGANAVGVVGIGGGRGNPGAPAKREKGPWIGIAMEPVPEVVRAQLPIEKGEGVVVNHVMPDSPAAKAGLEENDILLRFDDQIIVEPTQLRKLIAMKKPGDSVKLAYMRKGERRDTVATLIEHDLGPEQGGPVFPRNLPGGASVWKWEGGNAGNFDEMRKRMEEMQKQFKDRRPGVVVDKWSWFGDAKGNGGNVDGNLKDVLKQLREQLGRSNLPKQEQDKIRKSIEEALEGVQDALKEAKKGAPEEHKAAPKAEEEKPKKPGETL